ncbi:hypothetical protein CRYUN_Cryun41cG0018300 [Craigia yunnanensis]
MEEEQRKLDDEMEKRRRRVQEWQELRRKKEESDREKLGEGNVEEEEEAKVGKAWTLEGESDDDEVASPTKLDTNMDVDDNENSKPDSKEIGGAMMEEGDSDDGKDKIFQNGGNGIAEEDDEMDPLNAFMNSMVLPEVEKLKNAVVVPPTTVDDDKNGNLKKDKRDGLINGGQQSKKGSNKALARIIPGEDSDSDYGDVEKDEENLEDEDDDEFMKRVKKTKAEKLSIVAHSKIDYKPFRKNFYIEVKEIWRMTPEEVAAYRKELELKLHGRDVPKPIKTWHQTGLTSKILETIRKLNYEKPMPIQAQALPIIMSGLDCIGIAKRGSGKTLAFVLPMLRHIKDQPPVVAGDGPVGLIMAPTRELVQQIHSDIKKFAKALGIRCVPVYGGSGVAQQISELKRGTEIVVCTPGRMIDILCTSGGKISNLRRVEILARKVLTKPVEIQVGGRSVVNKDITQLVEMRPESKRFLRLLELLGEWYEKGNILIFVHSQEKCDALFRDLLKHARGLDVKELELVINFDVPNHYEDYVHRVGRTGRAGRKGCAITFISEDDARYAPDLLKALELSEQVVPDDLKALADEEDEKRKAAKKAQAREYGFEEDKSDSEDEDDRVRKTGGDISQQAALAQIAAMAAASKAGTALIQNPVSSTQLLPNAVLPVSLPGVLGVSMPSTAAVVPGSGLPGLPNEEAAQKAALQAAFNLQHNLAKIQADTMPEHYEAELEINEFPQNARWKVTHKETLGPISEWTGAAITTRGQFFPPGRTPGPGERKLCLYIEGATELSVKRAKAELRRVLEDISHPSLQLPGGTQPGRYPVL